MKDYSSIVVSCKVKLLRNLVGFNFPSMLDEDEGNKVLNKIADNVLRINNKFKIYKVKTLPELDINVMREKNLVSSKLLDAYGYGAVILSPDESMSIMINESDHIVAQCSAAGFNLISVYDDLNALDDEIISRVDIAFDDSIGFLTSSLNNIGTGLKASITMFLPALTLSGEINEIISKASQNGFDTNSFDDDADEPTYYYTLSNINTIGKKENEIIIKLTELAIQISEREITARKKLLAFNKIDDITDIAFRAWGILTNCHKIGVEEAIKLLGELKIGIALDLFRFKDINEIENLKVDILPYSLTKIYQSKIPTAELDKYRAKFIAQVLKANRIK